MQLIGYAVVLGSMLAVTGAQNTKAGTDDPAAVQSGGALFRERCADCHGDDAKGARGPDLTRLWTSDSGDQRAFQIIRSGVPGSIMPSSTAPEGELRAIVAYLRSISTAKAAESGGNVRSGEETYMASCARCHRINGRGGWVGPDLSRISASQSNQVLTRAIREPSASFTTGFEPVTLVTRDGRQIRGTRKSEDAFSIQIMDTAGRLQGYLKSNLRKATRDETSLMPDFGPDRLTGAQLNDLLAYLATFRVSAPPRRSGERPADDRQ